MKAHLRGNKELLSKQEPALSDIRISWARLQSEKSDPKLFVAEL
jgi:hypothetical protein